MSGLVFLIERTAIGLYILIGVAILWHGRRWLLARRSFQATYFELERDLARYQSANALTTVVLLVELGLIISGIQRVVAPTLREQLAEEDLLEVVSVEDLPFFTPTPPPPQEPTFDPESVELGPQEVEEVFVTPAPTPTPVGTIEPNAPAVEGCNTPNATLQIPANGMRVFQPIPVLGTAFTDDFTEYKIEISGPTTNNRYSVINRGSVPVAETGGLAQFNPAPYDPGIYEFRVVVFASGELRAACKVNIYISAPIATPTPLPPVTPLNAGAG
ncbi:MAG: hypothetical protein SF029_14075 [bacterium]|nr:hypothetical protein [bacterium]